MKCKPFLFYAHVAFLTSAGLPIKSLTTFVFVFFGVCEQFDLFADDQGFLKKMSEVRSLIGKSTLRKLEVFLLKGL